MRIHKSHNELIKYILSGALIFSFFIILYFLVNFYCKFDEIYLWMICYFAANIFGFFIHSLYTFDIQIKLINKYHVLKFIINVTFINYLSGLIFTISNSFLLMVSAFFFATILNYILLKFFVFLK